jgi:hypothetical protein
MKQDQKTISIGQLSRELKLSASTVSRALRDHPAIADDTIARVKQAAKLHGYKPKESVHRYFKALRGQVNGIALLVDKKVQELLTAHDPFYTQILWSVERALQKTGTHMILTNIHNNLTPRGSLHAIDEGIANGVIIKSHDPSVIANLAKNTAVVVLDSDTRSQNVDAVIPDVDRAVRSQMDLLVAHGHRRIANFRPKPSPGSPFPHWQDRYFWREYEDYAADLYDEAEKVERYENPEPPAVLAVLEGVVDRLTTLYEASTRQLEAAQGDRNKALAHYAEFLFFDGMTAADFSKTRAAAAFHWSDVKRAATELPRAKLSWDSQGSPQPCPGCRCHW